MFLFRYYIPFSDTIYLSRPATLFSNSMHCSFVLDWATTACFEPEYISLVVS